MKPILRLAFVLVGMAVLSAQGPSRPFPNHEQPPDGWFCVPALNEQAVDEDAHACACRGMALQPHCPTPNEDGTITEPSTCKVWCHPDACKCKQVCGDT